MKVSMKPFKVVCTEDEAWEMDSDLAGVCTRCGDVSIGTCEPDARYYKCEVCGMKTVFGFAELVMMGCVSIQD